MKFIFFIFLIFRVNYTYSQSFTKHFHLPDTLSGSQINLSILDTNHVFVNNTSTQTYGYNASFLGPTIILQKNQDVYFSIDNNLPVSTTVHWHGMRVPADMDGGPHNIINSGSNWSPHFTILDEASTMWYHSHLHHHTLKQITKGLAGMIIIRDSEEQALNLPRTYGVDDFPIIIQDKQFDNGYLIDTAIMGDSITINGVINPYLNVPASFVRFRLLNGSNHRVYNIGLSNLDSFYVIASDNGLLNDAVLMDKLIVAPGERYEILLDFTDKKDSTIYLTTYASEFPLGYPGGPFVIPDDNVPSLINGLDLPFIEIQVQDSSPLSVMAPSLTSLNNIVPLDSLNIDKERYKQMDAIEVRGELIWTINEQEFLLDKINDTVLIGSKEMWTINNSSGLIHPFHIHSGHFNIVSRGGNTPPSHERGYKDVVIVYPDELVKFVMTFEDYTDTIYPYMYHCHILNHEDHAMMAQFLIVDSSFITSNINRSFEELNIFPVPAKESLYLTGLPINQNTKVSLFDVNGKCIQVNEVYESSLCIDVGTLSSGFYYIQVNSGQEVWLKSIVVEKDR